MSLFSITSLLLFFACLGFAVFIYLSDKKSEINKSWLTFSIFFSLWGLSLFGVTSSTDYNRAYIWQALLDASAIFIPFFYYIFVSKLISYKNVFLEKIVFIFSVCLAFLSLTNLYKIGLTQISGFYWINPGKFYFVFPSFFILMVFISLFLILRTYIKTSDANLKKQIIIFIVASAIGFGGGITNFFPQLFNVYPFGNYFVLLYVFSMGYGVSKYKLLSPKVITAQLSSGALVLILLFNLLQPSNSLQDLAFKIITFILSIIFSIYIIRSVSREVSQREHIEKLAEDLGKANERLKELDKQKTEFVSIASHQLRSPLTAIKGYSSMLLEGSFGPVPKKAKEAIDVIFQSSQKMISVIEDFLNITRIELGRMKYEMSDIDVGTLARQVTEEQRPQVVRNGLKLEFEDDGHDHNVYADMGKLNQVFNNIIDNAGKYTKEGWIRVRVENLIKPEEEEVVRFVVKDSGVGIPPETLPKLFEKFVRAYDAGKVNLIGTGLGLYVAKQIVEGLGGKIWAESEGKGKGSTFIVELKHTKPLAEQEKEKKVTEFVAGI